VTPDVEVGARPLAGLTVLDFTRILAGPYCTRLLADLGARVIKIERPGEGDEIRRAPIQLDAARDDQSSYFVRCNAGKLGIAIDLEHPEGRAVVADLVRVSDVVIENFLPGVMARFGWDYAGLAALKPDLVYCSISGFGQTGPLAKLPGLAFVVGALSGLVHLEQGDQPVPPVPYLQAADVLAGTHAFGAITAALWRRDRTGQGAYLDVSLLQALVAAEDISFGSVLNGGPELPGPRPGMLVHVIAGRALAVQIAGGPQFWPRLIRAVGRPELAEDPRFATRMARRDHWPELRAEVAAWLDGFPSVDAALAALRAARLPCAPVLTPAEVVAHPHLAARGSFPTVPHPTRGTVRVTASPFHWDGRPVGPSAPAPYRIGEHTRAVLGDVLGYAAGRIQALVDAGAVAAP
jgi:CoA:oxalate CoA-transferase